MQILQATVRFWMGDCWGEDEIFKIVQGTSYPENGEINSNTELAKALLKKKPDEIIELKTGVKYLIVEMITEPDIFEVMDLCAESYIANKDYDLIKLGRKLATKIADAVKIPKGIKDLTAMIVSAHLNVSDVKNALQWINEIEKHGIDVVEIKEKLIKLDKLQMGIDIENIKNTRLLNDLGRLHRQLKAYTKSLKLYEQSLNLDKGNIYTLNSMGAVYRDLKMYDDGIDCYLEALKIIKNPVSYVGMGGIFRDLTQYIKAEMVYKQALEIDQDNKFAHKGLGAVYFDQGKYSEGERHFIKVKDIEELFRLFNNYYYNDLLDKSLACLNAILKIDPENGRANYWSKRLEYIGGIKY